MALQATKREVYDLALDCCLAIMGRAWGTAYELTSDLQSFRLQKARVPALKMHSSLFWSPKALNVSTSHFRREMLALRSVAMGKPEGQGLVGEFRESKAVHAKRSIQSGCAAYTSGPEYWRSMSGRNLPAPISQCQKETLEVLSALAAVTIDHLDRQERHQLDQPFIWLGQLLGDFLHEVRILFQALKANTEVALNPSSPREVRDAAVRRMSGPIERLSNIAVEIRELAVQGQNGPSGNVDQR